MKPPLTDDSSRDSSSRMSPTSSAIDTIRTAAQ